MYHHTLLQVIRCRDRRLTTLYIRRPDELVHEGIQISHTGSRLEQIFSLIPLRQRNGLRLTGNNRLHHEDDVISHSGHRATQPGIGWRGFLGTEYGVENRRVHILLYPLDDNVWLKIRLKLKCLFFEYRALLKRYYDQIYQDVQLSEMGASHGDAAPREAP